MLHTPHSIRAPLSGLLCCCSCVLHRNCTSMEACCILCQLGSAHFSAVSALCARAPWCICLFAHLLLQCPTCSLVLYDAACFRCLCHACEHQHALHNISPIMHVEKLQRDISMQMSLLNSCTIAFCSMASRGPTIWLQHYSLWQR